MDKKKPLRIDKNCITKSFNVYVGFTIQRKN